MGLNLIYMHVSLFTIDLESSLGPVVGLHDPLSSGLSVDTTFHVSGITASVSTRDILRALWTGNEGEDEVIRQLKYEIRWVDDSSVFFGTGLADDGRFAARGSYVDLMQNRPVAPVECAQAAIKTVAQTD